MGKVAKSTVSEDDILIKEWDFENNNELGLDPSKIGINSHQKVFWKCNKGHSWLAMISNRSRHKRGCPYCAHQLPIKGETDLKTLYPELSKEWHPTKNGSLTPSDIMPGTHKKVWWICDKGHEWEAEVISRVSGVGCPFCSNKKVLKGFNDLETLYPNLAKEWHPTKNGTLKPSDVTCASGKQVWWQCKFGHEWKTAVYNRKANKGCPKCSSALRTSFPEQAIYYYIKKVFPDAINGYKDIFKSSMELDIYIPSLKVGIEYDGKVYHSDFKIQLRDSRKYKICKEHGIILIRIKEMTKYTPIIMYDYKIEIPDASSNSLNYAIDNLCYHLGKEVVPDVDKDRKEILAFLDKRKTSLADEYPDIAAEWDYEKNYPLIPENFSSHSNEKVFWKCRKCDFVWEAAIGDRTRSDNTSCPRCALKKGATNRIKNILAKRGSFADNHPELLCEWDYEKNTISPYSITSGSSKKVWWKCKICGHEWESQVFKRSSGRGCPNYHKHKK